MQFFVLVLWGWMIMFVSPTVLPRLKMIKTAWIFSLSLQKFHGNMWIILWIFQVAASAVKNVWNTCSAISHSWFFFTRSIKASQSCWVLFFVWARHTTFNSSLLCWDSGRYLGNRWPKSKANNACYEGADCCDTAYTSLTYTPSNTSSNQSLSSLFDILRQFVTVYKLRVKTCSKNL